MTQVRPPRPRPGLSYPAKDRIDEIERAIKGRLYEEAVRRAADEGLDTVSERHVDEIFKTWLPNFERPYALWLAWADVFGGVLLGTSVQGLWTELTKPNRADWNVLAIVSYIIALAASMILIRLAKYR